MKNGGKNKSAAFINLVSVFIYMIYKYLYITQSSPKLNTAVA